MKDYRFVILCHKSPTIDHWDVMLESDNALTTWSIPPQHVAGVHFVCQCERLPDHRKHYLDYEGNVSDNRGTVSRIDTGTYEQLSQTQYIIHGTIFSGKISIAETTMVFEPFLMPYDQ